MKIDSLSPKGAFMALPQCEKHGEGGVRLLPPRELLDILHLASVLTGVLLEDELQCLLVRVELSSPARMTCAPCQKKNHDGEPIPNVPAS